MAWAQLSLSCCTDDGAEVDITSEVRGTDEQVREAGERLVEAVRGRPGPKSCRPPAPAGDLELPEDARRVG